MARTPLLIAAIIVMTLSLMSYLTPVAQAQVTSSYSSASSSSSSSSSKPETTTRVDRNTKEKLTKLEKAEEEVDKGIKLEKKRRENATAVTPKVDMDSSKEALCNNALQVDLNRPGSVILCTCKADEVLVNGTCQVFAPGTTILAEKHIVFREETRISNFRVKMQDVECDTESTHRNMTFEKDTFYLRSRGDVVLTDNVGDLAGLRISDYCINHYLDDEGKLSWRMKACIPHPVVPRCCPPNQVMKNGKCEPGPSPEYLYPPIHADPRGYNAITWPVVRNQVNKMTCSKTDELRAVDMDFDGSYLLALANGMAYRWYFDRENLRSQFMFCPDFCVDGKQGVDGAVEYQVHFCDAKAGGKPPPKCKSGTCIRKCCKHGEIMSVDHYRCTKQSDDSFNPPTVKNISHYEVIAGRPNCAIHLAEIDNTEIDEDGNWLVESLSVDSDKYCMDVVARQGNKKMMGLVCSVSGTVRQWWEIRRVLFPVCHVISLIFLGMTVGFYLLAPSLLKQGGWHQLSYVLSLMLAYATTFSLNVYHYRLTRYGCIGLALMMQLGFLSTFFWLTILCFDIESKIRSLRKFQAYVPLHSAAYVAFGFGGPLFICMVTLIMQSAVSFGTPGVIPPAIGVSKCWFHGDWELLIYFYGHIAILFVLNIVLIASTAWNYHSIEQGAIGLAMKSPGENGQSSQPPLEHDRQKQTRKNFNEFKHTFLLLALMCFCWITEVLSWKIPPPELWAFTDVLNSLQGFFIFIIFLAKRKNRKVLKSRHPRLYAIFQPIKNVFRKVRGVFMKKSKNYSNSAEDAREPSISSEFSELSENNKPTDPIAS